MGLGPSRRALTPKATTVTLTRLDNRDAFLQAPKGMIRWGHPTREGRMEGWSAKPIPTGVFGIEEETMDTMRCTFG